MLQISAVGPLRPPCSAGERAAAGAVIQSLRSSGWRPVEEAFRAPTSPTWVPMLRALMRVWAAAFLAGGWPSIALGLSSGSIALGVRRIWTLVRYVPLLGAAAHNVVARRQGTGKGLSPLVFCAHLDTHATAGAPMTRAHVLLANLSGWLVFAASLAAGRVAPWGWAAGLVAAESLFTLLWLARRELTTSAEPPDDNTSGLLALTRLAQLLAEDPPLRDVWLVATGAGTSGSYGITSFFAGRPDLRRAWTIEIDALGSGEVVAAPLGPRFPRPGTPSSLVRAVVAAAQHIQDPLSVRRVRRPHSDARAALRLRTPAIVLTGGLHPPAGARPGPDLANAERAARILDALARLEIAPAAGSPA